MASSSSSSLPAELQEALQFLQEQKKQHPAQVRSPRSRAPHAHLPLFFFPFLLTHGTKLHENLLTKK